MGKQSLYEHSVHVPLILVGPGVPQGARREAFCYLLDIFPTLCDLTGEPLPQTVEGKSLVPALRDPAHQVRETLLFAYKDVHRAVRDERFKLIEYVVNEECTTQLFDLQADPWELHNLAHETCTAVHLRRLRGELLRWRDELGDTRSGLGERFWRGYEAIRASDKQ
jgi:arylsulfatase A-like enzyme